MKNKSKISIKPIVQYFRELSVVVIGVAVTVSLGFWVNNKNNEKDLTEYLTALKIELEENIDKRWNEAKNIKIDLYD